PLSIAKRALELARKYHLAPEGPRPLNSFEEGDEVWAVFDRDEHPKVQEAIELCEANGIGIGYSNPCFELWLVLHLEDYDKPDGRKVVQGHLAKLCPEYDPKKGKCPNCKQLIESVEAAEERAKALLKRRQEERNPLGVASTTVGNLTSSIRKASKLAKG